VPAASSHTFPIPMGVAVESGERVGPVRMELALEDLPVRTVRVGPTAHPEIARLAMSYLLSDLDFGQVGVALSTIPLRA
jgi:hypothetical protein